MASPKLMVATLAMAGLLSFTGAHAQMDKPVAQASKDLITATYKADKAACDKLNGNAEDVCEKEAEGKEKVAKAELEYAQSNKPADATKVALVKAEAAYEVAKEKCDDKNGNDKDLCVKEAKAAHEKAKVEAKAGHS